MKNESPQIIERYSMPSELDTAPYLTLCINSADQSVWIQLEKDEEKSVKWTRFENMHDAQEFLNKIQDH